MADVTAPSWQEYYDIAKAEMQSLRTDLTFEDGDISDMICAGIAAVGDRVTGYLAERFKATYVDSSTEDDLTTLADDHWSIQRDDAVSAVGTVSITRPTDSSAPGGTIASGTKVATDFDADGNTVEYTTDDAQDWAAGEGGSKDVTVTAVETGRTGNVAAGLVVRIVDSLFDTFSVTNAEAMAGGADEESDESLRERVREHDLTVMKATLAALEHGAKEVDGIVNATAVEGTTGLVTIYVSDADGESNAKLVADVLAELEDWRAAGSVVEVTGGTLYTLTPVSITLQVRTGVDTQAIVAAVKAAIVARIDKLKIGETCTRALIQQAAMMVDDRILGCTVVTPAADVVPTASQVIRTTVSDITVA